MTALAEALGHDADDRLLILTADQLGMCHATNVGVYESLRTGLATGASLMVPAPWARTRLLPLATHHGRTLAPGW